MLFEIWLTEPLYSQNWSEAGVPCRALWSLLAEVGGLRTSRVLYMVIRLFRESYMEQERAMLRTDSVKNTLTQFNA